MVQARLGDGDAPVEVDVAALAERGRGSKPAPPPLDLVQQLLNTRNLLQGYDLLDDAAVAGRWLELVGSGAGAAIDEAALLRLRAVREALRDLLFANTAGSPPDAAVIDRLRATTSSTSMRVGFDATGAPVLVVPDGLDPAAEIEARVLAALAAAEPDARRRLKICANPGCGWAFHDGSRSRSGAWCVMSICGARHKMEEYRSRQSRGRADDAASAGGGASGGAATSGDPQAAPANGKDATGSHGPPT